MSSSYIDTIDLGTNPNQIIPRKRVNAEGSYVVVSPDNVGVVREDNQEFGDVGFAYDSVIESYAGLEDNNRLYDGNRHLNALTTVDPGATWHLYSADGQTEYFIGDELNGSYIHLQLVITGSDGLTNRSYLIQLEDFY